MQPMITPGMEKANILLKAYTSHVRSQLELLLRPVAEDVLNQALDAAVASLRVQLLARYEDYAQNLVINLSVDGVARPTT